MPDIMASKAIDPEMGNSSDDRRSEDPIEAMLEARRTLDIRFEEAGLRQRASGDESGMNDKS